MSASRAFQKAIVAALKADAGVGALVGDRIYDMPPAEATFPYISLGASDVVPADADDLPMRDETIQIDVWTRDNGALHPCRQIVDAARGALHRTRPNLDDPFAACELYVFLTRTFLDPDGITGHGVLQVTGMIEE